MTKQSYAPIFILVAALVPLSLLAIFGVGGRYQKLVSVAEVSAFPQAKEFHS